VHPIGSTRTDHNSGVQGQSGLYLIYFIGKFSFDILLLIPKSGIEGGLPRMFIKASSPNTYAALHKICLEGFELGACRCHSSGSALLSAQTTAYPRK
jgi:hypothetical protein